MSEALIILAAGRGSRMQSDLPKVLHKVAGAPLITHCLLAARALDPERTVVVTGHGADMVQAELADEDGIAFALQAEQLGTAHAVLQARDALAGFDGNVTVLYGDTPFIGADTLQAMQAARATADVVVLGFEAADPARYGRLVTQGDDLLRIVEYKDANEDERAITLCNSGVLSAQGTLLFDLLANVGCDNAAGEYYLPDIIAIARARGLRVGFVRCAEAETLGVNSRADLAAAEAAFQARARAELLDQGVTMTAPDTVFLSFDTVIGRDCVIEPNVIFGPGATVESGAHIRAFSHIEGAHVSDGAVVGPYARLRPGAELAAGVHIGNFVEVKNAILDEGVKANHLAYIGDAQIGARSNIGAGTITCNYDGFLKHKTTIGADAFIGSNTMLVAPVTLGAGVTTGSGSVITQDVPDDALALGRARQENKPGLARKLRDMLRAKKEQMKKGA